MNSISTSRRTGLTLAVAASLFLSSPGLALADLGVGVQLGGQVPTQAGGRSAGGDIQQAAALSVDVFKPPVIPLRGSVDLDYASGARGAGKLDVFGIAAAARLSTPIYAGASLGLYDVAARPDDATQASHVAVGVGSDLFAGSRLVALPGGIGIALQFDYRALPSAGGISGGALGAGVRVHF